MYFSVFFDKTLYSSPLMVVTDQEYSKHYFIEGERVCTKIGGGFWGTAPFMPDGTPVDMLYGTLPEFTYNLSVMTGRHIECTGYAGQWDISPSFAHLLNKTNMPESNQYFYHSDHLGSASFITDATGYVDQHIQYLPFGELFISQRNSQFDSRYKFTAKELDNETQYTYFGARYLDSDISIWLSLDPLSDKYPSLSPYAYCANNPVILVDPDGRYGIPVDKLEEYRRDYPMIMKYLEHHVENDVMGSPTILQGFMESSANNFTSDKVREAVHFGTGPELKFVEEPGPWNGHDGVRHGYYDASNNIIEINSNVVKKVDNILRSNVSGEDKLNALMEFYQILLHETAEYGNTNQNSPLVQKEKYNKNIEPGHYFEAGVWGGNPDCYIPGYHKMKDAAKCVIEQQRANGKTDTLPTIPIIE